MGADSISGPTSALLPAGRRLTAQPFWSTVLTHAIWWGRGVFAFIENIDRQPIPGSVRILNPYMVGVDSAGRFELYGDDGDTVTSDHDGRLVVGGMPWRIVAVRGLPPNNGLTDEGVLLRHFGLLRLGAHIHRYGENVFASGVPSGYLKVTSPNLTQDVADGLKSSWMAAHGGSKRSVAVLNAVTDYTPISINPVDADTGGLKQALLTDVAHAFTLSAAFLDSGGGGSLTYANITDRRREVVDLTLSAWAQSLMETIGSVLPGGTTIKVDWPSFTSPDLKEQLPIMVAGVQAGLLSRGEARRLLGLPADAQDLGGSVDAAQ
jgi:HK97 family phage portal protein